MRSIALALGASLTWGFADFFGPLKGRTLGALRVLVYVQLGGLVVIALVVAIRGKGPSDLGALFAIPAAISGTLGLYAYYRGMAVGAMSIVAPIAGISAAVPVVFGIATGDRPSLWQGFGIAAALGGVFLASREPGPGGKVAAGVGLALLAAIGFGCYFPPMHTAGEADFWWASLIFRMTSASVILAAVAIRRPSLTVQPIQVPVLALIGIGDMLGNLLFAAASTSGLVSITSVLASLFPIVTVVLARLILKERVARSQEAGIALTLAGVALISAG
ncbi:MAG TPA: DMT family transporter [Gaiellaceae bacterium]|jgi:drug/metabolite transporter (DMT)-like permease|nr:DMT family transporter [Gaiellaceae bacterium]